MLKVIKVKFSNILWIQEMEIWNYIRAAIRFHDKYLEWTFYSKKANTFQNWQKKLYPT